MDYENLVGYCAGVIDEHARCSIHHGNGKGSYDEESFSELTSYFLFLDFRIDISDFMKSVANVLMEVNTMFYFDFDNCLICFDKSLWKFIP